MKGGTTSVWLAFVNQVPSIVPDEQSVLDKYVFKWGMDELLNKLRNVPGCQNLTMRLVLFKNDKNSYRIMENQSSLINHPSHKLCLAHTK